MRASIVISSIPTSETLTQASITIPLSRIPINDFGEARRVGGLLYACHEAFPFEGYRSASCAYRNRSKTLRAYIQRKREAN